VPFLKGPADFAPNLSVIDVADWLPPDTEATAWLNDKRLLMKLMRDKVSAGDLNGAAAEELLALVLAATGETPLQQMPTALEEAASLVSDDFCILEEERRGDWRLNAGVLCAPTYWSLAERIDMDLGGLHGPVPGGDPGLAGRIGRIFSGLERGKVLERLNWTVQAGDKRYTPRRPVVDGHDMYGLHFRVERQTVRKLAATGAVVFTIRTCIDPLVPMLKHRETREAFEDAWLGTPSVVRRYKGWGDVERLVAQACRAMAFAD
jgi:hypothetical protein